MPVLVFFVILIVLFVFTIPVAGVFGGMAFLPSFLDPSFPYTVEAAIRSMVNGLDSFTLLAVPLFILSGIIMARGGISEKIFDFFAYFIGNKTGGFPCAVIGTCMFYSAISGSSPATVAAVGSMSIPFLVNMGYDKLFSTALVTVSGGLGVIIPPSISYIVYASSSSASPSKLFIGGIIPGLLITFCLMVYAYFYCRKHKGNKELLAKSYDAIRSKGFLCVFKESFWALVCPIIILGSIYTGITTPTEAAAISVIYALFISIFVYKKIGIKEIVDMFFEGVKSYVPILFIISAATAFGRVVAMLRYSHEIGSFVTEVISNKYAVLIFVNLVMLVFGMFLDNIPNIMLLTPIFLPIVKSVGVDPVHFGIMMTVNLAVGMVTPPMGINLYIANSLTGEPVLKIAKATVPFLIAFLAALCFIIFVPSLSLWLPSIIK
ncbi:TRAP transporter large permease [Treponema parvum]|uniref:TRAP transporter large permease n=1 Tax=Treponema parvum TaxID=138851 RepID=UPI001AEC3CB7|nr:TRAP transporter large permease [Treponema parvum]QTQ17183.1 TRAP transporter large permease [Treponema parvum]